MYYDDPLFPVLRKAQESWIGWSTLDLLKLNAGSLLENYRFYAHAIEPEYLNEKALESLSDNPSLSFSALTKEKHSTAGPVGVVLDVPPELILFAFSKDVGSGGHVDTNYGPIATWRSLYDLLKSRYSKLGKNQPLIPSPDTIIEKTKPSELNELIATTDPNKGDQIKTRITAFFINKDPGSFTFREGNINRLKILGLAKKLKIPVIEIDKNGVAKIIQDANGNQ